MLGNSQLTLLIQTILDNSCQILNNLLVCDWEQLELLAVELEQLSIRILKRLQNPERYDSKFESR